MSSLPARRPGFSAGSMRAATYAGGAAGFGLAGWLVAGIPDAALVPMIATLALAAAVALAIAGVRAGLLASPLILLGVPLLLSLAAAMQPITRIFGEWSLATLTDAILIVVAPLAGVGAAMLATGRTPRLQRGTAAEPHPGRLVTACLLMCVAATAAHMYEWSSIGGPPLLSPNIDAARFSLDVGALHLLTQGLPLALLIATWARVGHAQSFNPPQRRALEAVICFAPIVLVLGGGRSLVLLPLVTALIVAARYLSPRAGRLMVLVIPIAILLFSTALLIAREGQHTESPVAESVLFNGTGTKSSPPESAYRALSIGLGEQLRVVAELRDGDIRTPPFTSSLWFAHNITSRALDPHTVTGPNTGGWLTSTYAGPLLLDFGLIAAVLFGFGLGAAMHMLYRLFAHGRSVTIIWVYAYLAAPVAVAFYINVFLYFVYPIVDVIALIALSRLLIKPDVTAAAVAQGSAR